MVWGTVAVGCSVEVTTIVQEWVEGDTTTSPHITGRHMVTVRPAVDPGQGATVDHDHAAGSVYYTSILIFNIRL